MSELSPSGRGLLEAARLARPTAVERTRMDARFAAGVGATAIGTAVIGAAPAPAAAAPVAAASGVATAPAGSIAKSIAIGVLLGAVGGGVVWVKDPLGSADARADRRALVTKGRPLVSGAAHQGAGALAPPVEETPSPVLPASSASSPAPVVREPLSPPPMAAPAHGGSAPRPDPRAPAASRGDAEPGGAVAIEATRVTPAPSSSAVSLSEEVALLQAAQRALTQGDGARALSTLDQLAARHPDGALREERHTGQVLALCAAGRVDEAREAGRRFLAEMPGSVQAERVRASCAFAPKDR